MVWPMNWDGVAIGENVRRKLWERQSQLVTRCYPQLVTRKRNQTTCPTFLKRKASGRLAPTDFRLLCRGSLPMQMQRQTGRAENSVADATRLRVGVTYLNAAIGAFPDGRV